MTYTLTATEIIIRDADNACIPSDPRNTDYQAYLKWLAGGNTPAPFIAGVAIPPEASRRQFFEASARLGIITDAEALASGAAIPAALSTAILTLPAAEQFSARMAVLYATSFRRADPLFTDLGPAMGQTPTQIDALFTLAASL